MQDRKEAPLIHAPLGNCAHSGPSFSFKSRAARAVWNLVYAIFFKLSPRPFHGWRSFLLRAFGANLGKNCHIYRKAVIWAPWNLECGDEVAIADDVKIYNQARIIAGNKVVISQGSHLCTGTHNYESANFELIARPILIGENAWICAEAFIHPGIKIGAGAVVGARSVVTRDMPEWTVCAGNPCKPLKPRKKFQ